eukprot:m.45069 g.45069  ORF g.45069 m.45069 type:complete len:82 (-) comp19861_c1_seq1:448-693(-)
MGVSSFLDVHFWAAMAAGVCSDKHLGLQYLNWKRSQAFLPMIPPQKLQPVEEACEVCFANSNLFMAAAAARSRGVIFASRR